MGARSRNSGKDGELQACKVLDPLVSYGEVITTRNAGGGGQRGLDLCVRRPDGSVDPLLNGWGVEVKFYGAPFPALGKWDGWLDKAAEDTPPGARGSFVIYRMKGSPQWWVATRRAGLTGLHPAEPWLSVYFVGWARHRAELY